MFNKSKIVLNKIEIINKKTVKYHFSSKGKIKEYFLKNDFQIEYDFSLDSIPNSILCIPFISNVLPMLWINKGTLYIDEIDKTFYDEINNIKYGYQEMIPKIILKGKVKSKKIISNTSNDKNKEKNIVFFSGGVDSTSSLVSHINENIETFTIWGSDIAYDNIDGWENVKKHIDKTTKKLSLNSNYCRSNFRDIINYDAINEILIPAISDNYWHAYQHSIAIISHAAPYCYKNNISNIYFPATRCPKYKKAICASFPTIDNHFNFANTKTIHDGYEYSRLDKVKNVINYNKKNKNKVSLRVCWQSLEGINCTTCEKCFRTILEILTLDENPENYDFLIKKDTYEKIRDFISNLDEKETEKYRDYYKEIINELKNKKKINKNIKWILELNKF